MSARGYAAKHNLLPRANLRGAWLLKNGLVDSIGLLITRDQVIPTLADIFFDGEVRRDDATIATNIAASPLLNTSGLVGSVSRDSYALYAIGTPLSVGLKAYKFFHEACLLEETEMIDDLEMLDILEVIV